MTGRQLSHYTVDEKIGEGGMGVVFKGTDTRLKRTVALKFLTQALPAEAKERKRFLREARAASAVNHPNVCVIHAIEEVEGEEFIVMEFVEGMTLRKWAHKMRAESRGGLLRVRDMLVLATQVAEGLDAAHKHRIVHRDVKPENVMVTADGRAKIMDFGLAKLAGESKLTRTGATVGTVAYMSPEQVQGGEIDAQSDIYSFGVLLYELLTGSTPFQADHVMGMMYAIVSTEPRPPRQLRRGIDPELERIVMKSMAKEKSERYGTMREVIGDIVAYEESDRTALAPALHGKKQRTFRVPGARFILPLRRKPITAAAGALLVVVVIMVVFVLQKEGTSNGSHMSVAADSLRPAVVKKDTGSPPPTGLQRADDHAGVAKTKQVTPEKPATIGQVAENARKPGVPEPETGELKLELLTNKGTEKPLFSEGDTLRTFVRVNRPCTVRVFYHSADSTHYVLTGPHDLRIGTLQINALVPIDSSTCSAPFGAELIQAFATTGRFESIRTTVVAAGYYAVAGDIGSALRATRGTGRPGEGSAAVEKSVAIRTIAR